ncbi:MAG: flagellar hook basal-body protein [Deltaproteobacteria bacterium]|nr:flagellar hook basal-body protein [Deltaproteobacteria bacterium]
MDRGVYVAITGGIGQDRLMEAITGNLAGSNVVGFKRDVPVFSVYDAPLAPPVAGGMTEKVFANATDIFTDFSQGMMKSTGNPLDVAISGDGFFVVQTPDNNSMYTRKGDFTLDSEGRLTTKGGYAVEGEGGVIQLTPDEASLSKISIEKDGTLSLNGTIVDKIRVVTFPDPNVLRKAGSGLFAAAGGAAGVPAEGEAAVMQGHLEMANVNAVGEMVSMMTAMRAYESGMKLIQGFDTITDTAIKLASA